MARQSKALLQRQLHQSYPRYKMEKFSIKIRWVKLSKRSKIYHQENKMGLNKLIYLI